MHIVERIKEIFGFVAPLRPRKGAASYAVGGFWGDKIEFFGEGWPPSRIVGWKTPRPKRGDVLTCVMKSGKTAVWIIGTVNYCDDPKDMFFADIKAVGYADEINFDLPSAPQRHPVFARMPS